MATLMRVARTSKAMLSHTFYVGTTPTDPTGTPTVTVVAADGVSVQSGNATVVGSSTGLATFALNAVATLERLTVTWSATVSGVAVVEVDYVEIVGGFFFGLAEARFAESAVLASTTTYPDAALETARVEVEVECEEICDRAFVPRYRRLVLDGTGSTEIIVTDAEIRTVRSVSIAARMDATFVALTVGQLAAVAALPNRVLRRVDGLIWTEGIQNVVVEYEYGLDQPAPDLKRAGMQRLRSRLGLHRSGVPDRAISMTVADGGTYRIDMPGPFKVGIPDIDAIYGRYSLRPGSGTGADGGRAFPISRPLNYDPQRNSIFHGGIR